MYKMTEDTQEKIKKEYDRLLSLFGDCQDTQIELVTGLITEAARIKIELDDMHLLIAQCGTIQYDKKNPLHQRELPISKTLVKVRASYSNIIYRLSQIMNKNIDDDAEELSKEYE